MSKNQFYLLGLLVLVLSMIIAKTVNDIMGAGKFDVVNTIILADYLTFYLMIPLYYKSNTTTYRAVLSFQIIVAIDIILAVSMCRLITAKDIFSLCLSIFMLIFLIIVTRDEVGTIFEKKENHCILSLSTLLVLVYTSVTIIIFKTFKHLTE